MRDSIVVSVKELYKLATAILLDGCQVVEISINEAQNDEDPQLRCPPFLWFAATDSDGWGVEYGDIDAVDGSYSYAEEEDDDDDVNPMRDHIVVPVGTLYLRAKEMIQAGCSVVKVSISDVKEVSISDDPDFPFTGLQELSSNETPSDDYHPVLFFTATNGDGHRIDFEHIDAVEGSYTYSEDEE